MSADVRVWKKVRNGRYDCKDLGSLKRLRAVWYWFPPGSKKPNGAGFPTAIAAINIIGGVKE